jgi:tripartite motif-containing protein 71
MSRHISAMLTLLVLICVLPFANGRSMQRAHAMNTAQHTAAASDPPSPFIPLPKSCGGGLPPGENAPVCCMFGYVFIDGQAVAGAKVTISIGQRSIEEWSDYGPDSPQPYYRTSLSTAPLSAQAGETITITAEYSSHTHTITHTVLGGGQQVDVVLPRNAAFDYVFDRQIWHQAKPGTFNQTASIAVDATNTVYVVDGNNSRVQVFDSSGQFIQQWGTQGGALGTLSHPTGIAIDHHGDVYLGDYSNFRIQKFSRTGTWLAGWGVYGAGNGQFNGISQVSLDANDNVYVADIWNNRIQKFRNDGKWLANYGTPGIGDGELSFPQGVAVDQAGNVFVADWHNHRIQKFNQNGGWLKTWGSYGSANGQFIYPSRLGVDQNGNLYVTDDFNHRIQKFTNNGDWLANVGSFGNANGQFNVPSALALDTSGNIYISGDNRVQKFNSTGAWMTTWGGIGSVNGQLDYPEGVVTDTNGNIYIANNSTRDQVQKFSSDGSWLASWGGAGSGPGQFNTLRKIAIDKNGSIFVADAGNSRVQKFTSNGVWLASWGSAGNGNGQFSTQSYGMGISVDKDGNVYVVDTGNDRIEKFSNTGQWLLSWGGFGGSDGQFNVPRGISADQNGNIYVADTENSRIQKFNANGQWLQSWGSFGSADGQFSYVSSVSIDAGGNVYAADLWNSRIQKFNSSGTWLATWGSPGGGSGQFDRPEGVYIGGNGNMYVADGGNSRVQILRPMTYTRPIATIVATGPRSLSQGQPFDMIGMGSDSDATSALAGYEWTLDGSATPFATSVTASLPTSAVSAGQHTISFRVRDTEGEYSDPQSITINISSGLTQPETWTFLLYLDGDAPNTAPFLNLDSSYGALYRLTHAAPNPNVTVVALYDGPLLGGGDSFRYIIRPDGSFIQEYRGEVNMGDPQTLSDFVAWGMQQAPATHYYLSLADHANALDGIAWDFTSGKNERLTNGEIRQALVAITENGAHPIDVLHFDGCLMGLVENAYQVRGLARYLVASENLGWSAFAYDSYRAQVGAHTSPAALAAAVADQYAAQVGAQGYPYTISALDLAQVDAVERTTDALASELLRYALISPANRTALNTLRGQVQKFDSGGNFVITNDDEYVDLAGWAEMVQANVSDSGVQGAAAALQNALPGLVVREHHASGSLEQATGAPDEYVLAGAHGVGIYYPPRASVKTYQTYVQGELNFATDTHWDEYLAAGLTALPFDPSDPVVNPVAPLPLGFTNRTYLPILLR